MKPILRQLILLLIIINIFSACKKDSDGGMPNPPPPETCTLDRAYYYDDPSTILDTAGYVYNGTQLTKINSQDYYIDLVYTGNNVTRKNYFEYGTTPVALGHDEFTYNGDNTLNTVEFFYNDPSTSSPVLYDRIEFTYSGGKLTKTVDKYDTSSTGNEPLIPILEYNFTHTANNITRVIITDLLSNESDTINYEYDANENYYSKIPFALYADQLFTQFDGVLLPIVLSANNVTRLSSGSGSTPIGYDLDSKDNLTSFLAGGETIAKYFYKCQ